VQSFFAQYGFAIPSSIDTNFRPERVEHHSPGQGVLAAALGTVPNTISRPVRARQCLGVSLPLQGGLLEEDYVSQGVALG